MPLLFDTHVHYHPDVDPLEHVLDAAARNLTRLAGCAPAPPCGWRFGLCLFDLHDQEAVSALSPGPAGRWQLHPAPSKPAVLVARRVADGAELNLLRGQQWVTSEGLEVLTLGRSLPWEPKQPAPDLVARLLATFPVLVLPWGAGKWLGRREHIVRTLVEAHPDRILLGDSGGRPAVWSRVALLDGQRARGCAVPAGTDPLPIRGDADRVGSYATRVEAPLMEPDDNLFRMILNHPASVTTVGTRVGTWRFLNQQARLRLQR